jgi:hypothetical protein
MEKVYPVELGASVAGAQQDGLTVTGRGGDERQAQVGLQAAVQRFEQPRTAYRLRWQWRDLGLGGEKAIIQ